MSCAPSHFRLLALPATLALLTVSGCFRQIPPPDIKENPARHEHYQLTMTLRDVPGPYDSIDATVDYSVSNSHCVPLTPISGAALAPYKRLPLPLTQVGPNTWKADFYADMYLDEDYYHEGVCHWAMVAVSFGPTVKGNIFSGSLWHKDMLEGRLSDVSYFANQLYLKPFDTPYAQTGSANREQFKEPDKTFSTTMTAVKIP
ncbi:hypothetical protein ACCD10_01985 [Pseudomonas sp. Pseusp122]|uniref:hypothetical protein n=1 Tax=unclassified Pseudomonas TaxID=196821 RepID=UPI0039A6A3B6